MLTNVPYLGRGNQDEILKAFAADRFPDAKADLATVFLDRALEWVEPGSDGHAGTVAAVTPQNWLFLTSYKKLREQLLKHRTWDLVARLGPGAFETIGGHVVNVALLAISAGKPDADHAMLGIDASAASRIPDKAAVLRGSGIQPLPETADEGKRQDAASTTALRHLPQAGQRGNPDSRS